MSAVKPMRLSFHHIIDPSTAGGESTSGSPFKKRFGEFFTGGTKGFGFEDIFQSASPDKTRRTQATSSPLRSHQQHIQLRLTSQTDEDHL